jgi:hypothetical protein
MISERFNRWVRASQGLALIHEHLVVTAQGLGRLDSRLIDETPRVIDIFQKHLTTASLDHEPTAFFNDHILFSYLWVLAAYELARSVDQRSREEPALFSGEFSRTIKSTKIAFERIRIPLAKFEPARRHHATDNAIAWPAVEHDLGGGWSVSKDIYVSRRQLADGLLSTLEILKGIEP